MKKLIIAAALIVAGATVNAASIDWGAPNGNYTYNGAIATETSHDAGTFALAYLGTTESWAWENASVVNQGTVEYGVAKGAPYASVYGSYTWTYDPEGKPANNDVFGVVFVEDGTGKMHYLASTEGSDLTGTFVISGMDGNTYAKTFAFSEGSFQMGSEIGNVPEPTSGLLVLMGLAGLMLRRKHA